MFEQVCELPGRNSLLFILTVKNVHRFIQDFSHQPVRINTVCYRSICNNRYKCYQWTTADSICVASALTLNCPPLPFNMVRSFVSDSRGRMLRNSCKAWDDISHFSMKRFQYFTTFIFKSLPVPLASLTVLFRLLAVRKRHHPNNCHSHCLENQWGWAKRIMIVVLMVLRLVWSEIHVWLIQQHLITWSVDQWNYRCPHSVELMSGNGVWSFAGCCLALSVTNTNNT